MDFVVSIIAFLYESCPATMDWITLPQVGADAVVRHQTFQDERRQQYLYFERLISVRVYQLTAYHD